MLLYPSQCLFNAINSEKNTVENENENLTERMSQLDEEVKKVKKDLQESREKLKRSDEVRYSVFVFDWKVNFYYLFGWKG